MRQLLDSTWKVIDSDDAATAVEYALMLTFIALVIFAGATALGLDVLAIFENVDLHDALS